jgi:hypothetical protein
MKLEERISDILTKYRSEQYYTVDATEKLMDIIQEISIKFNKHKNGDNDHDPFIEYKSSEEEIDEFNEFLNINQ